ncbi:hypothetical protein H6F77_03445 [Microcoleus sp. FACHB-831]|uniref:hypothetical protein n=1 Tax=Microcoleus sp. FACHB-831 TaxID=2692827 RepID=UPI0016859A10|nr:hypothetical protein [Microcoleus sp. FACHB-831]MBD1920169.1 hypothetical protein [Microcoleus sp. FACHB-831]
MTEELKPDPNQATTQDAQLAAESMLAGNEDTPEIDVAGDYEASKAFSVSAIDTTEEGAKAAEAATAPDFKVSDATEMKSSPEAKNSPDDYRQMAADVNPQASKQPSLDSDDLVKRAIELGKPGN